MLLGGMRGHMTPIVFGAATLGLACFGMPAAAIELTLPDAARVVAQENDDFTSYALPISAWENGEVPSIWAEGAMARKALKIDGADLNTMQILAPLRDQLTSAGYDILFECKTHDCGGFDFRFGTEIMPEPDMHVDLGDFRFLSAQKMGVDRPEYVSLMVSKSRDAGFVQLTTVGDAVDLAPMAAKSTKQVAALFEQPGGFMQTLSSNGSAVLADLSFATGSSTLDAGRYTSLSDLAAYLRGNPDQRVLLVGHTDFEGSLTGNVSLSRKRAGAVRDALIEEYGVAAAQVEAEGVGYLSPRASNLTAAGRTENRRVEVILTSTD